MRGMGSRVKWHEQTQLVEDITLRLLKSIAAIHTTIRMLWDSSSALVDNKLVRTTTTTAGQDLTWNFLWAASNRTSTAPHSRLSGDSIRCERRWQHIQRTLRTVRVTSKFLVRVKGQIHLESWPLTIYLWTIQTRWIRVDRPLKMQIWRGWSIAAWMNNCW